MHQKLKSAVGAIFLLLTATNLYSQTNLYEWFDNATGKTDIALYNGPMYYNQYRSLDPSNNPFLGKDEFSLGDVIYDGQVFYNVPLKYDIKQDILLAQPIAGGNSKSIQLISQRVNSFNLLGNKFVNLSASGFENTDFKSGYYEESVVNPAFTFYIKHRKNAREIINGKALFSDFSVDDNFFVLKDSKIYQVKSKKNVISLFPDLKMQINDYYKSKKSVDSQFMEDLFKYINTILK